MLRPDQSWQTADDTVHAEAKPPGRALAPVVTAAQWSRLPNDLLVRSNSGFVAHLIATAEHLPQTRSLRRATPSDALSAYKANQSRAIGAGLRARQTI